MNAYKKATPMIIAFGSYVTFEVFSLIKEGEKRFTIESLKGKRTFSSRKTLKTFLINEAAKKGTLSHLITK